MSPTSVSTHPLGGEVSPKPSTRRPTLVRKFADANLEADKESQTPLSSVKRTKVAFNNEVEINLVEDWDKAPELIGEEVRRALERHHIGDDSSYEALQKVFRNNGTDTDSATLRHYTGALLSNVSLLDASCWILVQLVLKINWAERDETYVILYQRLIFNLALSKVTWLNPALQMLVDYFRQTPRHSVGSDHIPPRQVRARIHTTLRGLLKLIPSASQNLAYTLNSRFPYISESKRAHVRYVHNLLRIVEYAPELRSEICSLIMDRIVKIDVQIQVDIDDFDEDIGEKIVQDLLHSAEDYVNDPDTDSTSNSSESDLDSVEDVKFMQLEQRHAKEVSARIHKLDLLLDMTFNYFTTLFANPVTQEAGLDMLFSHFTSTILPTYQSRHTQFLVFHFAQTSPELIDIFIGILVRTISDRSKAPLIRQTAASYLASFVARGKHVSATTVQDVFKYLSVELRNLRNRYMPTYRGPDPLRYSTYYALSQVLMYVYCFRWRDLRYPVKGNVKPPLPSAMLYTVHHDDYEQTDASPEFMDIVIETFSLHCFSGLNPLKVCSPTIVAEFARITRTNRMLYIYPTIESNKRVHIVHSAPADHRETALTGLKSDDYHNPDAYFPFDPYKLPRSKKWLEGDYRDWQPIPDSDDEQDGSDSDVFPGGMTTDEDSD